MPDLRPWTTNAPARRPSGPGTGSVRREVIHPTPGPPRPAVTAVGWLIAAWCTGFAVVNIAYEATGRFDESEYAEYATGLAVMSWLVVLVKLVGAAVAVLAVRRRPSAVPPRLLGAALWGATALLSLYSAGNVVQLVAMLAGSMGGRDEVTPLGLAYVGFFLLGAAGYAVLTASFSRRHPVGRRAALVGVVGAPLFLTVLLVAIPLLLTQLGLLPE